MAVGDKKANERLVRRIDEVVDRIVRGDVVEVGDAVDHRVDLVIQRQSSGAAEIEPARERAVVDAVRLALRHVHSHGSAVGIGASAIVCGEARRSGRRHHGVDIDIVGGGQRQRIGRPAHRVIDVDVAAGSAAAGRF